MQQIKIFVDIEANYESLEDRANAWLAESDVEIVNIFGNIAPQTGTEDVKATGTLRGSRFASSDLMIAIVYEK